MTISTWPDKFKEDVKNYVLKNFFDRTPYPVEDYDDWVEDENELSSQIYLAPIAMGNRENVFLHLIVSSEKDNVRISAQSHDKNLTIDKRGKQYDKTFSFTELKIDIIEKEVIEYMKDNEYRFEGSSSMFNKNDKEHRIRMTFKSDDKTIHNCLLTADANGNSAVFKIPDAPKLQKIFKSSLQKKTPSLEI